MYLVFTAASLLLKAPAYVGTNVHACIHTYTYLVFTVASLLLKAPAYVGINAHALKHDILHTYLVGTVVSLL